MHRNPTIPGKRVFFLHVSRESGSSPDVAPVTLCYCLMVLLLVLAPSGSSEAVQLRTSHWYGGIGIGISELKPDPDTSVYFNRETRSQGGQLFLGYQWSARFGIEAHIADLGEAEIGSLVPSVASGRLGYKDYGISALFHLYRQHPTREGLNVFLRVGVGRMENETELPYERLNDEHVLSGIGFEYGFSRGLALRSGLIQYDADSRFVNLALMVRFPEAEESSPIKTTSTVPPSSEAGIQAVPSRPKPEAEESNEGWKKLGIVHFPTDSARLDEPARSILDRVISELQGASGDFVVKVEGHADSRGSDSYNMMLSERRIEAVTDYLVSKGVAKENLWKKPYGERCPVASNETAEGRRQNRRVELHLDRNGRRAGRGEGRSGPECGAGRMPVD